MKELLLLIMITGISLINAQSLYIPGNGGMARLSAIGQNPYVTDPENMRNNPAWGNYYRNVIWLNYGTESYSGEQVGVNVGCGDVLTIGGMYNRNCSESIYPFTIDNLNIIHKSQDCSNYEVFTSAVLSDMVVLGGGLAVADIAETQQSKKQYGVNIGTIIKVENNFIIDAATNINLPYSFGSGYEKYEYSRFNISFRGFYLINQKASFVTQVYYLRSNADYSLSNYAYSDYSTLTDFRAGMVYRGVSTLFSMGGGIGAYGGKYGSSSTYGAINLGAEFYILKYVIARAGFDGRYFLNDIPFLDYSNVDVGFGVNISKFQLDGFYSYNLTREYANERFGAYFSLSYKY